MARLEKGLEDYYRIPVLLKPIADTPQASVAKLHSLLSVEPHTVDLEAGYERLPSAHSRILDKRRPNTLQQILFRISQYTNDWSEFEVIYKCRFIIGVFDSATADLAQEWKRAVKADENRKLVGLIILSADNCNLEGVDCPFITIRGEKSVTELYEFFAPWLAPILATMEDHICFLISELQREDNGYIVFNKMQDKPQPRTLKKKKKGRCLKVCGDLCLVLHLTQQAYQFYKQAEQILKKVDDDLWMLGCSQGKLACLTSTSDELSNIDYHKQIEQARQQCLTLGKRIKVPVLETENYFKLLKIHTTLSQTFDQMARDFLIYISSTYTSSQKFSILTQLAMLYKQAKMIRKHNYILYLAARMALDLKPGLGTLLLDQITKSSHIKQWPLINANVIKMMIDNGTDSRDGVLHLDLLESCCSVLTPRDVEITLESLERRNFKELKLEKSLIFDIVSVGCIESEVKPKLNRIGQDSPVKNNTQSFFMSWRKKETIYQFQQNQAVKFEVKVRNNMSFPLRISLKLHFTDFDKTGYHSFILQPKLNKVIIQQRFPKVSELIELASVEFKLFNFLYSKPASSLATLKLQIYEQYPDFKIDVPEVFKNQESSLFELPLRLLRSKKYLGLQKLKLTVSVFYTLEIGFQETQFEIENKNQEDYLIVTEDYPYEKPVQQKLKLLKLAQFRANKKYLKKLECKVDAIRSDGSKYQISKMVSCLCTFERSIWCELISITTPTEKKFGRTESSIIQEEFIMKIAVSKKPNDLTPYKIIQDAQSYLLSQQTTIFIEKRVKKYKRSDAGNQNSMQVSFEWSNLTKQKQKGTLVLQVPFQEKMILSDKSISFTIENWSNKQKHYLKNMQSLKINYTLSSTRDKLSHRFVVQPLNVPSIRKYIVQGKTIIKPSIKQPQPCCFQNQLEIKFFYQYEQHYMLGLKFDDGSIFWFPSIFVVLKQL